MWHEDILGTIGDTPLVRLNSLTRQFPCTVLAKVEFFNPGASVKDRIGLAMVEAAERAGTLRPGGTIIEGTSGNTGAGLALAAIAKGYHCIFTTTDKQSQEKVDVLRALGAEVIVCPTAVAPEDPRSYYSVARRLAEETPNSVYLNQYDNPANAEAHYQTTGPEIWEQTEGRVTHYVAGAGTGGTISGTGRYLKEQNPDVRVIGVDPFGSVYHKYFFTREFDHAEIYPYVTEGVGEDILAKNMDFDTVDDYVRVSDRDAMVYTRRLAREEGLFVGQSCGMAVAGVVQWLEANRDSLSEDDVVVVVLPDSGFRYLSKTYNDTWMRNHGFLSDRPEWTLAEIAAMRRGEPEVLAVSSSHTLGEAIDLMTANGISQVPVIDDDQVVGSLSETVVLNSLLEGADRSDTKVASVMAEAIPVVPPSLHLQHLSAYLEQEPGAVLLKAENGGYRIITKSDLIRALSTGKSEAAISA
ncbi:MAG: pyridoxal-phosphate dependent enzyme [Rhodothermales bacterium]|nr:pyridoxal-phosphate dependent enzyme [Rhodothermales bacterium]